MSDKVAIKAELDAESVANELIHDKIVEAAGKIVLIPPEVSHEALLTWRARGVGKVEPDQASASPRPSAPAPGPLGRHRLGISCKINLTRP
jgi:hypothetical protein